MIIDFIIEDLMLNSYLQKNFHTLVEEILGAVDAISGKSYDFCGVIRLADAVNFINQLTDLETVYRQLKYCHLAVITKSDLVEWIIMMAAGRNSPQAETV